MTRSARIIDLNFPDLNLNFWQVKTHYHPASTAWLGRRTHYKPDLRETVLVLHFALPTSLFFQFQQNSLLPLALWFSPLALLNMGSQPFSTVFFFFFSFPFPSPQVAGGEGSQGQIEIFSLNRPMPRAVKSLQVGAAVRCLEYVPEPSPSEEAEAGVHKAPSGIGTNICVGSDDGRWDTDNTKKTQQQINKLLCLYRMR